VKPEISVVIPIYRAVGLLQEAIESVLKQTFEDFEIVLSENNASAETLRLAEGFVQLYPEKIRIVHEPTPGVCSSRNRGILESHGKYIALLDEDDLMLPERLERQYSAMINRPELSLITCKCDVLSYDGTAVLRKNIALTGEWGQYCLELTSLIRKKIEHGQLDSFYLAMPSTFFFPRQIALQAGLFDPRMNPQYCEDDEFQIRMFEIGGFHMFPQSLIYFRDAIRKPKYSTTFRLAQSFRLLEILWDRYGSNDPNEIRIFRKIYSNILNKYGLELFGYSDGSRFGRSFLQKAFYCNPDIKNGKLFLKSFFPKKYHKKLFWIESDNLISQGEIDHGLLKTVLSWFPRLPKK
jgi:glycosyltransferase involved in cell wall biosynthesis